MTPDDLGVYLRDDPISRVVSQVRKMEDGNMSSEGLSGINNNYKFEIERTDSLEFTRNSETVEPFDMPDQEDEMMENDVGLLSQAKSRRSTFNHRKDLDRRQDNDNDLLDRTQEEVDQYRNQAMTNKMLKHDIINS